MELVPFLIAKREDPYLLGREAFPNCMDLAPYLYAGSSQIRMILNRKCMEVDGKMPVITAFRGGLTKKKLCM